MSKARSSGILLHPTSLPGRFGIGDLGPEAYKFVDFLRASGQKLWQMLPLGPTGYGDSPYQTLCAFGGNPVLISPELLESNGLLDLKEIALPDFEPDRINYQSAIAFKEELLHSAHKQFISDRSHPMHKPYKKFCKTHAAWLEDTVLFFAIKAHHDALPWTSWPETFRDRDTNTLKTFAKKYSDEIDYYRFTQFLFFEQFGKLHDYAASKDIRLIGDMPIFVAHDSSDVWSHPDWFKLDKEGKPTAVAGVPPDYFSETGQRWGNPLYDWKKLKKEEYGFWVDRFRHTAEIFDIVRIDHFRGFASYWEIPANEETAINGKWKKGPRAGLFKTMEKALGKNLPVIAEDLGVITEDVTKLLKDVGYPGMAVLQFGFESMQSDDPAAFLPHNLEYNQVVYTGTHDNSTVMGWWEALSDESKDFTRRYLNTDGNLIHRDMLRAALGTVCKIAIIPMQDLLGLGSEANMNEPGTTEGNWQWRMREGMFNPQLREDLLSLTILYGRASTRVPQESENEPSLKPEEA